MADTDPITQPEMMALFGSYMPMAAIQLLWEAPDNMTAGEVRQKLRRIARLQKIERNNK